MQGHSAPQQVMECKAGAPEGEVPPTQCPVCLDPWDTDYRLPKFLSCHHSVCVTCLGRLHRAAKTEMPPRPQTTPQTAPTSPLARFINVRTAPISVAPKTGECQSARVKCPLCRATTPVPDPAALQTNFYLRGLYRAPSLPRLVLWCETCDTVAAPHCSRHNLQPLPEKLRNLQKELRAQAGGDAEWAEGRGGECGRQVEVYRWVSVLLRHAHDRLQVALTQAEDAHRRLHTHAQNARSTVGRGEELVQQQEPADEVVAELVATVATIAGQRESLAKELGSLALATSFPLEPGPRPPRGYRRARISLHVTDTLTLSFSGEEEMKDGSKEGKASQATGCNRRSGCSHSLKDIQQERPTSGQARRSRSFHQARPKTPQQRSAATTIIPSPSGDPQDGQTPLTQEVTNMYDEGCALSDCHEAPGIPPLLGHSQQPPQENVPEKSTRISPDVSQGGHYRTLVRRRSTAVNLEQGRCGPLPHRRTRHARCILM